MQIIGITPDLGSGIINDDDPSLEELQKRLEKFSRENQMLKSYISTQDEQVRMMIHDLKNPIGAIYSLIELLETSECQEEAAMAIDQIKECSLQSIREIECFLSEENNSSLGSNHLTSVDVQECIDEAMKNSEINARLKGISIERPRFLSDDSVKILSMKTVVVHAIENLMSNAIKYSLRRGKIRMTLWEADDYMRIGIIDNGVGIPFEEHDKVFQENTYLSNRPSANESSNGLGLQMIRSLVKRVNGNIGFRSVPGEGSYFWVEFPVFNMPKQGLFEGGFLDD